MNARQTTSWLMIAVGVGWLACDDEPTSSTDGADTQSDATDGGETSDTPTTDTLGDIDTAETADSSDADVDAPDDVADSADGADLADTSDADDIQEEADVPPPEPEGPPVIILTINDIPPEMNGSMEYYDGLAGPYAFTLVLPTWDFTLDVWADRDFRWLDPETLEVSCDADFGELLADSELGDQFAWESGQVRWLVEEDDALATDLTVTCTATVSNLDSETSEPSSITFDTLTRTAELDPFDVADTWLVTFSRDHYDVFLEEDDEGELVVSSTEGGDGDSDFLEDMATIGLQGDETGEGASTLSARGVTGANAVMAEWILHDTMAKVRELYGLDPETGAPFDEDSVNLTIYREGDEDAPDPDDFDDTFSIHGVGGDAPPDDSIQFGLAHTVDVGNHTAQNDGELGYGSFTTNLVRLIWAQPEGRLLLRSFLPGDGTPIGEDDSDAIILADGFNPTEALAFQRNRYQQLVILIDFATKALASLIAHEIGHSLGLVACGPPPTGLFGGVYDDRWMVGDPGCAHIDLEGLNVMQTGGSLLANPGEVFGEVRFEPLSIAYLRGRLLVVP